MNHRGSFVKSLASSSLRLLPLLALLDVLPLGTLGAVVRAGKEYVPDPEMVVPAIPFGHSLNHRGYWCSRQEMLLNGTVSDVRMAIEGETITVAIPYEPNFMNFLPDGSIDPENPGVYVTLMDEVARRGRFNWKFTIHEYLPNHSHVDAEGNEYFMTDLLLWLTQNFDISESWWLETNLRVSRGISFASGWYDASIIIISRKKAEKVTFDIFSWSGPFSRGVWILLIITLIVTAIILLMLEGGVTVPRLNIVEFGQFSDTVFLYIHKAFVVFTGHMDLETRTVSGQLVTLSLSFFVMLMLAAYTANLTQFLVSRNLDISDVYTVGQIVKRNKSMCIINAAKKEVIQAVYPDTTFVLKETETEALVGLMNFECDYAIAGISGWQEFQTAYDGGCGLVRIGRVFKPFKAGFAMATDSGIHCTSLLREVFHLHFLEMQDDGFIDEVWNAQLKNSKRIDNEMCLEAVSSIIGESEVLTLTHMSSIFLFHGCFVVIAIISAKIGKYYTLNWREKVVSSKIVKNISKKLSSRDLYSEIVQPKNESSRSAIMLDLSTNPNEKTYISTHPLSSFSGMNSFMDIDEDVDEGTGLGSDDIIFLKEQLRVIIEKLDKMSSQESTCENRSSLHSNNRTVSFADQTTSPVQLFTIYESKTQDET